MISHVVTHRDELAACYEDYFLAHCEAALTRKERRDIREAAYSGADFMLGRRAKARIATVRDHFHAEGYDTETAWLMAQAVCMIGRDCSHYQFSE